MHDLPSRVVVYLVLAAGLFAEIGYGQVWARMYAGLDGLVVATPTGDALAQARFSVDLSRGVGGNELIEGETCLFASTCPVLLVPRMVYLGCGGDGLLSQLAEPGFTASPTPSCPPARSVGTVGRPTWPFDCRRGLTWTL